MIQLTDKGYIDLGKTTNEEYKAIEIVNTWALSLSPANPIPNSHIPTMESELRAIEVKVNIIGMIKSIARSLEK